MSPVMATCPWAEEVDVPGGSCTQHDTYKDLQPEFTTEIASGRKKLSIISCTVKYPGSLQGLEQGTREAGYWVLQTGPFL